MIVNLEGEIRAVKEAKKKTGELVKSKEGKPVYIMRVEQKTDGPTVGVDIGTEKNTRKVGEKVNLRVNVYAKKTPNGNAVMKVWEV